MSETVRVGRVGRPHGVAGAFVVEEPSDDPSRFAVGAKLLAGGEEVEVVESRRVGGGRLAIRLDRPVPRGIALELPLDELPEPEDDAYYVFQLVGLRVEEEGGRALEMTWNELGVRMRAIGARVQHVASRGDRVAILAPQGLDYVAGFFAAIKAGAIDVPLFAPELPGHAIDVTEAAERVAPEPSRGDRVPAVRGRPGQRGFVQPVTRV